MSNFVSQGASGSQESAATFQMVWQTVRQQLSVIENPKCTAQERKRACDVIRNAFESHDSQEAAFARKLQDLMKTCGVTQAELALRMGCSQPAISQMLKRKCRPQRSTIVSLAVALNVDPRELWPDLEVAEYLDSMDGVQQEQILTDAESDAINRAIERPATIAPASPLPKRRR